MVKRKSEELLKQNARIYEKTLEFIQKSKLKKIELEKRYGKSD